MELFPSKPEVKRCPPSAKAAQALISVPHLEHQQNQKPSRCPPKPKEFLHMESNVRGTKSAACHVNFTFSLLE